MRKKILAAATVLVLAATATTSAMAFGHKAGHAGSHVRNLRAGGTHSLAAKRNSRFAGVRGSAGWGQGESGYRGGFIDLGPFGIMAACGLYSHKHGYCGPGYSVSAWSY
jgi:hypothetical protein